MRDYNMYNFQRVALPSGIPASMPGEIVAPRPAPGKAGPKIVRERSS
jgi:hypothetical protein